MSSVNIGTDFEVFLNKINSYTTRPVPAIGLFEGTKEKPHSIGNGISILVDNVSLEANTPVHKSPYDMWKSIEHFNKYVRDKGYNPLYFEAKNFFRDDLKSKEAQEIGCEPDFNVYTQSVNKHTLEGAMRYSGGHIHLDVKQTKDMSTQEWYEKCFNIVKLCDVFVEPVGRSTGGAQRRTKYGYGSFRIKPYGVEYRTIGNGWAKSLGAVKELYKAVKKVYNIIEDEERTKKIIEFANTAMGTDVEETHRELLLTRAANIK